MLDAVDPRQEALEGVAGPDRHRFLQDNRPMVHLLIDEMDRHPGDLRSPGQRITNRVGAGKRRQQGRMDIENPAAEAAHEDGRENPHEPGQAHQLDAVRLEQTDEGGLVAGSRRVLRGVDVAGRHANAPGAIERSGSRSVANDHSHANTQPA